MHEPLHLDARLADIGREAAAELDALIDAALAELPPHRISQDEVSYITDRRTRGALMRMRTLAQTMVALALYEEPCAAALEHDLYGAALAQPEPDVDAVQAGADALLALIRNIGEKGRADCRAAADEDGEQHGDARDYRAMSIMVERTLAANLGGDSSKRQGFLRALTDLFSQLADGCGLPSEWDPLQATEAAFAAA